MQTWGEIRSLIKADIAPAGPKAKDRNPFSCFTDRGYFGRTFANEAFACTEDLERFCLHTPDSLDAQSCDRTQPLVPRKTNTSSFHGVVQMVNYLARRGISITTPELRAKLETLKVSGGRVRAPAPRFNSHDGGGAGLAQWLSRGLMRPATSWLPDGPLCSTPAGAAEPEQAREA